MKMNLSVVLKTIDQASAPLKKVSGEYGNFTPRVQKVQKALVSNKASMLAQISAMKSLKQNMQSNSDQINVVKERMAKLNSITKSGNKLTAAQTAQYNKAKAKLATLTDQQANYRNQLSKTGSSLKAAGVNTKRLSSEESRLNKEYEHGKRKLASITKRYSMLNSVVNRVKKSTSGLTFGGMIRGFGAVNIAGGAGLAILTRVASEADRITKTAQNLKMSLKDYQAIRFQAEHAGVASETMGKGMVRFTKRLGVLQTTGTGALGSFLKKGKSPLYGELKRAKTTQEAYEKILGHFSKLKTNQQQMAFADAAFGQDGRRMLIMLRQGTQGLTAARKEFTQLGGGLNKQDAKAAEDYSDAIFNVKVALDSIKYRVLTPIMKNMTNVFIKLVKNFKNAEWRTNAINQVKDVVNTLFQAFSGGFKILKILVNYFPEVIAGMTLVKTAMFALNAAMMANPIGLVVAGIAALTVGVVYAITRWKQISVALKGAWEVFKSVGIIVGSLGKKIGHTFMAARLSIKRGLLWPIKQLFKLLGKIPSAMLPDSWHKGIEKTNTYLAKLDENMKSAVDRHKMLASAKVPTLQQAFNQVHGSKNASQGKLLKLTKANAPLLNLNAEHKALQTRLAANNNAPGQSIIKSQAVNSKAQVELKIKSDKPVQISSVSTDKNTQIGIDTGSVLGSGF